MTCPCSGRWELFENIRPSRAPVFVRSPFKNRSIRDRLVDYSLNRPVPIGRVTGFIEEMLMRRNRGSCGASGRLLRGAVLGRFAAKTAAASALGEV
jgi:hypothetical protein